MNLEMLIIVLVLGKSIISPMMFQGVSRNYTKMEIISEINGEIIGKLLPKDSKEMNMLLDMNLLMK